MPNGGWDCCAECPHSRQGVGSDHPSGRDGDARQNVSCMFRSLPIQDPYHTYCANHPEHNRKGIRFPVGRVFGHAGDQRRMILVGVPNLSQRHRRALLRLVRRISTDQSDRDDSPFITSFDVEVVTHIGLLGDIRALAPLSRIANWDLTKETQIADDDPFSRLGSVKDAMLIGSAQAAIIRLDPRYWVEHFGSSITDLGEAEHPGYRLGAVIRYQILRAIGTVHHTVLDDPLEHMTHDPVDQVRAYAYHIRHQLRAGLYDQSLDIAQNITFPNKWGVLHFEELEGADETEQ